MSINPMMEWGKRVVAAVKTRDKSLYELCGEGAFGRSAWGDFDIDAFLTMATWGMFEAMFHHEHHRELMTGSKILETMDIVSKNRSSATKDTLEILIPGIIPKNDDWLDVTGLEPTTIVARAVWSVGIDPTAPKKLWETLLRKAADLDHPVAVFTLAPNTDTNPVEGFKMHLRAAKLGVLTSIFNTAVMYLKGIGTEKNIPLALEYYQRAMDRGHKTSRFVLAHLYINGEDGVPKDVAKAIPLFSAAAADGEHPAMYALGESYRSGDGIPKNDIMAFNLFMKAAPTHLAARIALAECWGLGRGCGKNTVEADRLYADAVSEAMRTKQNLVRKIDGDISVLIYEGLALWTSPPWSKKRLSVGLMKDIIEEALPDTNKPKRH